MSKDVAAWAQGVINEYGGVVASMLGIPQREVKSIVMQPMDHPAQTSGDVIYLDPGWFRDHPNDRGAILHEYTHVLTSGTSADSKRNEALADVARYKLGMGYKGWQPNDVTLRLANLPPEQLQARVHHWLGTAGDDGLDPGATPQATATTMAQQGYTMPTAPEPTLMPTDTGPAAMTGDPHAGNPPTGHHTGHSTTPDPETQNQTFLIAYDDQGNMYRWYGAGDPRNGQPGEPKALVVGSSIMDYQQYLDSYGNNPGDSTSTGSTSGPDGKGGKAGDNPVTPPGLDPTDKATLDLLKRIGLIGPTSSSRTPYAPFGWLEPTRRQGEEQYLSNASSLYFQIWGQPPPPGYLEGQIKDGKNFYEMFDAERQKPAFRHTKFYRDQYAGMAQGVAQALGMTP